MTSKSSGDRREFLLHSAALAAGLAVPAGAFARPPLAIAKDAEQKAEKGNPAEEVTPTEDLMREHGLLNRILLIYDHHLRLLDSQQGFDPTVLASAADIIKRFVEDYHEKLEEDYLFPRFRKAANWSTS